MLTSVLQPTKWSCTLAAFAMVSKTPIDVLEEWIGHDGSELIFPELGDRGRRAFTAQECMMALFKHRRLAFLTIEMDLDCILSPDHIFAIHCPIETLQEYLTDNDAVLSGQLHGKQHSLAWCSESKILLDPSGFRYPLDKLIVSYAHILCSKVRE